MRPVKFAVELVVGMAIAVAGAWLAAHVGGKLNDKVNRQAQAGERIAAALERAYPPPKTLPKPSLLASTRLGDGTVCKCSGDLSSLGAIQLMDDCGP